MGDFLAGVALVVIVTLLNIAIIAGCVVLIVELLRALGVHI